MRVQLIFAASIFATSAFAATPQAPLATPLGITFQVTRTGVIYADAHGKTLYTADAACSGDCAQAWAPVMAAAAAKPVGDWSVTAGADGTKQWALKGKPLYTSTKDEKPGDVKGTVEGWHVAA